MGLEALGNQVAEKFAAKFGHPPRWIVAAPGRVNLIGEHTDYNDGFVLPMAIEHYTVIAADRPLHGGRVIQLVSTIGEGVATIDLARPLRPAEKGYWANYCAGVFAGFVARGVDPGGFDALIHSTVPPGGGLSSSAALEVSTATLVEAITGQTLDPVEKALLCQQAEHEFAGVPCGIMDQFISVMAKPDHLLLLDCRSRATELVSMADPSVAVLILNTNVKHELGSGEYAKRRAQCEVAAKILGVASLREASADALEQASDRMDAVVFRRARHIISEIERTLYAAEGIRASNWPTVGQLMYASHASLRDDYEVSCRELDVAVEIAENIGPKGGVIGSRMTGGGFGGCTVTLVKTNMVDEISKKLSADYKQRTRGEPALFMSRPAAGATIIKG